MLNLKKQSSYDKKLQQYITHYESTKVDQNVEEFVYLFNELFIGLSKNKIFIAQSILSGKNKLNHIFFIWIN